MSIKTFDRARLRLIDQKCKRMDRELAALYHRAVQIQMPLETLSCVAKLSLDLAAIHTRAMLLRYPTEGAA